MPQKPLLVRVTRLSILLMALVLAIPCAQGADRPLILLTNDDGVGAPGLEAIYRQIKDLGDVVVIAPAENQSGVSHSIQTYEPIYIKPYSIDGRKVGYSLKATPATCVIIAVDQFLNRKPDLVISGINFGSNAGFVAYLSGTVSASRQAAMIGLKGMAISLEYTTEDDKMNYAAVAKAVRPLVQKVLATELPKDVFLNVNAPPGGDYTKGLKITHDSRCELVFDYKREVNPRGKEFFWVKGKFNPKPFPEDTDMGAMRAGYIAVTPLTCNQEGTLNFKEFATQLGIPSQ